MKRLLTLAVLAATVVALTVSVSQASALCVTCVYFDEITGGYHVPAPESPPVDDGPCAGHGGVSAMVETGSYWRGGLLVIVYQVTCADGHSFNVEEESSGGLGISYDPPPETEYATCPGPDDPAYDPNNEACQ